MQDDTWTKPLQPSLSPRSVFSAQQALQQATSSAQQAGSDVRNERRVKSFYGKFIRIWGRLASTQKLNYSCSSITCKLILHITVWCIWYLGWCIWYLGLFIWHLGRHNDCQNVDAKLCNKSKVATKVRNALDDLICEREKITRAPNINSPSKGFIFF